MEMSKKQLLSVIAVGAYMALIWVLSSMPSSALVPEERFGFTINAFIKHFVEFGILGLLLASSFAFMEMFSSIEVFSLAVVIGGLWGVIDELHQIFVPTRVCDYPDAIVDVIGVIGGAVLLIVVAKLSSARADEV